MKVILYDFQAREGEDPKPVAPAVESSPDSDFKLDIT